MNTWLWLDDLFAVRVAMTLVHFLWQGAAIALLVMVGDWLLRKATAQTKYLLHVVAISAMAACLPITFFLVSPEPPAINIASTSVPGVRSATREPLVTLLPVNELASPSPEVTSEPVALDVDADAVAAQPKRAEPPVGVTTPGPAATTEQSPRDADGASPDVVAGTQFARVATYFVIAYLLCVVGMLGRLCWRCGVGTVCVRLPAPSTIHICWRPSPDTRVASVCVPCRRSRIVNRSLSRSWSESYAPSSCYRRHWPAAWHRNK